jgi:hypothetical protein
MSVLKEVLKTEAALLKVLESFEIMLHFTFSDTQHCTLTSAYTRLCNPYSLYIVQYEVDLVLFGNRILR